MKKSIISAFILVVLFLSGVAQTAQNQPHYYFFCINTTENLNAQWVVEQIDPILESMTPKDKFTVYYTTGTDMSDEIMEEITIEDYNFWKEKKKKLKAFTAEKIQCNANANMENIMELFKNVYEMSGKGLVSNYVIDVYWFGDDAHYQEFGESLVLNAYITCAGDKNWRNFYLMNNCAAPLKKKNVQDLLNSKLIKSNNIFIK